MPKSKIKLVCVACNREYSASVFCRHVKEKMDETHEDIIKKSKEMFAVKKEFIESSFCKGCGVVRLKCPKKLFNYCIMMCGSKDKDIVEMNFQKKDYTGGFYHNVECFRKSLVIPWNKGLTKYDDERIMNYSNDRIGNKNPIFKILNDEEKKKKWIESCVSGSKEYNQWKKGKKLEEILGVETAQIAKEKMSVSYYSAAKNRGEYPHQGKKHSKETCELLKYYRNIAYKKLKENHITKNQKKLYDELLKKGYECELEYEEDFYHIDIAIIDKKIAIEVDGDFFHVNEQKGFFVKYEMQKRNLINDRNKNKFLGERDWIVLRIWDSSLEEHFENCLEEIQKVYNER